MYISQLFTYTCKYTRVTRDMGLIFNCRKKNYLTAPKESSLPKNILTENYSAQTLEKNRSY